MEGHISIVFPSKQHMYSRKAKADHLSVCFSDKLKLRDWVKQVILLAKVYLI